MELFGLKDENGKDVKLVVTDDSFVHPHPIMSVESIEPIELKPEFEVPRWYVFKHNEKELVFYATEADGDGFCEENNGLYSQEGRRYKKYCRYATPQEIEAHLRKICDEEYVGKFVSGIHAGSGTVDKFYMYFPETDSLKYRLIGELGSVITVYYQGKFAEIVPDGPKELPKTVEELKKMIQKFWEYEYKSYGIDEFLKKQGYKIT